MYQVFNYTDNDDIKTLAEQGPFRVIEYQRDLSVTPMQAETAWFMDQMKVRKRQAVIDLAKTGGITLQAGAMQWMLGDVRATPASRGSGTSSARRCAAPAHR